jgi:GDP/UDP-N,N'-diacetylbacillosamine 2-epimerase (hydrolysing)
MRKICVVSSTRADFGLLLPLLKIFAEHPKIDLNLLVSGSADQSSQALIEVKESKIPYRALKVPSKSTSPLATAESMAAALQVFAAEWAKGRPDLLLILGDRYEIFQVAASATLFNIPIAHLHGGELTLGAYDDAFRHSITKMASLHFVSHDIYRKRVIQMGENPNHVFAVGATYWDTLREIDLLCQDKLSSELGIAFKDKNFLVTFHPETKKGSGTINDFIQLLEAIKQRDKDELFIFTEPNTDTYGDLIREHLKNFVQNNENCILFESLGHLRYLSLASLVNAVIGNSSSGVAEVAAIGTPSVNIGDRQRGRIAPPTVVNCHPKKTAIFESIDKAMALKVSKDYRKCLPEVSSTILNILLELDYKDIRFKEFYDVDFKF